MLFSSPLLYAYSCSVNERGMSAVIRSVHAIILRFLRVRDRQFLGLANLTFAEEIWGQVALFVSR